jgi:glycogen debranching enzyme
MPGVSKSDALAMQCAAIPGHMRLPGGLLAARTQLEAIAGQASSGILHQGKGKTARADVMANLWFVRAAHEFAAAAGGLHSEEKREHLQFAVNSLLPMCRTIVQNFIGEKGMDGVRMDDGGMLAGLKTKASPMGTVAASLRLNALWYAALETTGQALRGITPMHAGGKDPSGDHFERLAGRFRRSFAKAFWCEEHERICPQDVRTAADHGALPDAEQLLLAILPSSPLPRTKQRGILLNMLARGTGTLGVLIDHPEHGRVESPLHRAWLAQGLANVAENDADRQQVLILLRALSPLWHSLRTTGAHMYYRNGEPIGKTSDELATAEILGTLERFIPAENHTGHSG